MIYNLIGSGILVAVGAAGMWAWMRARVAIAKENEDFYRQDALSLRILLYDQSRLIDGRDATISRLSDTVGQLQYKRDKTLEYCKQFRVRGAVVAGILSGEQDQ